MRGSCSGSVTPSRGSRTGTRGRRDSSVIPQFFLRRRPRTGKRGSRRESSSSVPHRSADIATKAATSSEAWRVSHVLNIAQHATNFCEKPAQLKSGFESRREGPKEVRSSLRRQSFSSDSKREVIAQPSVEPAVGSHPRRGNFAKRRVACGEPEKARGLLTG